MHVRLPGRFRLAVMILAACASVPKTTTIEDLLDLTAGQVVRRFGASESLCYRHGDRFLSVADLENVSSEELEYVYFGRVPDCQSAVEARAPFPDITTARGLRVGDSYETVLRLYGATDAVVETHEREGIFAPAQRERLGRELQYGGGEEPVLSIFVKDGQVTAFAVWIAD